MNLCLMEFGVWSPAFRVNVKNPVMGSTGHWPVSSGDPPDETGRSAKSTFDGQNALVCLPPFRSASRRPGRASRPFHPFVTRALQAVSAPRRLKAELQTRIRHAVEAERSLAQPAVGY